MRHWHIIACTWIAASICLAGIVIPDPARLVEESSHVILVSRPAASGSFRIVRFLKGTNPWPSDHVPASLIDGADLRSLTHALFLVSTPKGKKPRMEIRYAFRLKGNVISYFEGQSPEDGPPYHFPRVPKEGAPMSLRDFHAFAFKDSSQPDESTVPSKAAPSALSDVR